MNVTNSIPETANDNYENLMYLLEHLWLWEIPSLSPSLLDLAGWPTHVVPVTCEIICASGAMWFYLGFCASCLVFVFKQPLLPCMYDSIRFGPISRSRTPSHHCGNNAPASCTPSCCYTHSLHILAQEEIDKYQQDMRLQEDVEPFVPLYE